MPQVTSSMPTTRATEMSERTSWTASGASVTDTNASNEGKCAARELTAIELTPSMVTQSTATAIVLPEGTSEMPAADHETAAAIVPRRKRRSQVGVVSIPGSARRCQYQSPSRPSPVTWMLANHQASVSCGKCGSSIPTNTSDVTSVNPTDSSSRENAMRRAAWSMRAARSGVAGVGAETGDSNTPTGYRHAAYARVQQFTGPGSGARKCEASPGIGTGSDAVACHERR